MKRPKSKTHRSDRPPTDPSRSERLQAGKATKEILNSERYYRDDPPQWEQGRSKRPCESAPEARAARLKLMARLRRFGENNPKALAVQTRLASCRPRKRCKSGACPECGRAWQRWFVEALRQFLRAEGAAALGTSTILSIVHPAGIVQPGELDR